MFSGAEESKVKVKKKIYIFFLFLVFNKIMLNMSIMIIIICKVPGIFKFNYYLLCNFIYERKVFHHVVLVCVC